jgi:hypothetical protein
VGVLVRLEICMNDDSFELLNRLVATVLPTVPEGGDDGEPEVAEMDYHATLSGSTLAFYYRPVFEELTRSFVTRMEDADSPLQNKIDTFCQCANTFFTALTLAKKHGANHAVLSVAIKQGRAFLDEVLRHLDLLDANFKQFREGILAGIKQVQAGTRILQIICEHGKRAGDVAITTSVPFVRRSMERYARFYTHLYLVLYTRNDDF